MLCVSLCQGKEVQKTYMDAYKLARPIFNGIAPDVPACEARIDSKVNAVPSACLWCWSLLRHLWHYDLVSAFDNSGADHRASVYCHADASFSISLFPELPETLTLNAH